MKPRIGLKLWSNNNFYNHEINRLWDKNIFDYIELYVLPGSNDFIDFWRNKNIPYVIHCAHSKHGFNLSLKDKEKDNKKLFIEAIEYFNALKAYYLILHPGVTGNVNETVRQLNILLKEHDIGNKIVIENKPLITLNDEPCIGSSPEDIYLIKSSCNIGFCLDIVHGIKYSIGKNIDWHIVLSEFMNICPDMLHVSDCFTNNPKDEHLNFGHGELNFKEIFSFCKSEYITIESEKRSGDSLADFEEDAIYLTEILK